MQRCTRSIVTALLLASAVPSLLAGDAVQRSDDKALREKWHRVYHEIAASLVMQRRATGLDLHDSPLLYYSNPVRTTNQHGSLFLWTEKGRPAVLGSIWSAVDKKQSTLRNISHEFHSLSEDPEIEALIDGQSRWRSGEAGIAWRSLGNAPAPGRTRTVRLSQMRDMARGLTARITAEEENVLRLMPQPVYRYPDDVQGAIDGALFVFALATDPEIAMLIEASADSGEPAWKIAFARFGNLAMEVRHGEKTVWTCERGTPGKSAGKYYLYWRAEQRAADLSDEPAAIQTPK